MNKTIGFGIIGLGTIAQIHVKAIETLGDCRFAAGFDSVPGKAAAFCKPYKAAAYDDLNRFLHDPAVDIVTVTTPSGAHMDAALAAIQAGKHVIVEKPMEITTERCDKLIRAAEDRHVLLSGVFQSRFQETPRLVKQAVETGRFGRLTLVDAQVKWFRTQEYYDSAGWRGTWKLDGGGALMNQSIHAVDLLQWFAGPVAEVSAYCATLGHTHIEVEDTAAAILKFRNGALGVIEGTTAAYPGFLKKLEICGTEGSVILEEESLKAWAFKNETEEDKRIREKYLNFTESGGGASDPKAIGFHGHAMLFADVVGALRGGHAPGVSGEEARKSVAIIEAIYTSAREHRPVTLEQQ